MLAVGRVAKQKNYPMLVRALARLGEGNRQAQGNRQNEGNRQATGNPQREANRQGEIVALIAGAADDEVLAKVRAQYAGAAAASAIPALHFLGPRDDISELAAAADVFALTSVWEARALVLQEALMTGKAIVATATGGSAELVGDAGILIDHDDDAAFAAAVAELAVDPARRAELGARARARGAELPDEREVAEELAGLYTELVSAQVG